MKKGNKYIIRNYTQKGEEFIEGIATILQDYGVESDDRRFCEVQFENGDVVGRWVKKGDKK